LQWRHVAPKSSSNDSQAREKLKLSEKQLSGVLYERGIDGQGFARIRSKGDTALFGRTTEEMSEEKKLPGTAPRLPEGGGSG
jgi:DNA-damage-inducible protein D